MVKMARSGKEPGDERLVRKVAREIHTRTCPTNANLICAVRTNTGGVTRAFDIIEQLANHICEQYGKSYADHVRVKNPDTVKIASATSTKSSTAPDIKPDFPRLSKLITYNDINYIIYDSPRDGSCLYHSVAAILPLLLATTPNAVSLRGLFCNITDKLGDLERLWSKH